jgi:hypothetical protein
MSNPSNLYAEKVFAEHPTGLWALDDKADYISLLSESQRNLSNWTITGGTYENYTQSTDEPFINSYVGKITATPTQNETASIIAVSNEIMNLRDLNEYLRTFSVGGYFYSESAYVAGFEIGYQYTDTTSGQEVRHLKNYDTVINSNWIFISETFDTPPDDSKLKLVFKINFIGGSETEDVFLVNGISLGQWSEEFASTSLGVEPIDISDKNIAISSTEAVVSKCYGLQELDGYYLVSDNMLKAKNSGIPIVYGTSGLTTMYPNGGSPSLIIPGVGFLNEAGKFKQYTFETWLRINSYSNDRKRIIGPLGSQDGVYVDGPSIGLKIGNEYSSYYVGEWTRPMLLHVRVGKDTASLVINGQEVISLNYITEELSLPTMLDVNGKDQDWIGFYAYDDIYPIEIDCVGIYPYIVATAVAKRRFVFGQGVDIPENINTSYSGTSVFIDYSFADYTSNYSYPRIGSWTQGFSDNVSVANRSLSVLSHPLPEIVLSSKTEEELFLDCKLVQSSDTRDFFSFRPNESWNSASGYLFFKNFDFMNSPVSAFYGCFKLPQSSASAQTLIRIEKENTSSYFLIQLLNNQISYVINYNGTSETIYSPLIAEPGELVDIGLNIPAFVARFGNPASNFFGSLSDLRMYVGGDKSGTSTFTGRIYNLGICTAYNFQKIRSLFNEIGVPIWNEDLFAVYQNNQLINIDGGLDTTSIQNPVGTYTVNGAISGGGVVITEEDSLLDHIASYTILPETIFDTYKLTVSANAYWEDQLPLTYFAESVIDKRGDQYFDLDFIQFNVDYPIPSKTIAIETTPQPWTYAELASEYGVPVQRTYTSLDNYLFTGYNDYEDLKNKVSKDYRYDTDGAVVKTYVTFQYTELGANQTSFYFTKTERPSRDGVLIPGHDWMTTKYEVVDNMIIYPPSGVDFNDLSIVTHIEMNVKNSQTNNVAIKKLAYSSQALNESDASPIGTRFGTSIYPYTKTGIYYNFKKNNPFSIYTGSSPYLYLTKTSGIQLKGKYDPLINRGLVVPVNESRSEGFKVIAMQMAVRFDGDYFPYAPTQIFEVQSKDSYIKFYMVACDPSGRRAKIYAIDAMTGLIQNGIGFYLNGKVVKEPILTLQEWSFLGINFSSSLNFSFFEGAVRLTGPLLFNSISYYQSTNLQEVQNIAERPWFRVKVLGSYGLDWEFWNTGSFNWNKVLVLSETSYYGVNPSDIYKSYTGTNKIIVDDDRPVRFSEYAYTLFTDVNWNQFVQDPV